MTCNTCMFFPALGCVCWCEWSRHECRRLLLLTLMFSMSRCSTGARVVWFQQEPCTCAHTERDRQDPCSFCTHNDNSDLIPHDIMGEASPLHIWEHLCLCNYYKTTKSSKHLLNWALYGISAQALNFHAQMNALKTHSEGRSQEIRSILSCQAQLNEILFSLLISITVWWKH